MRDLAVALDVGTRKICTIVAEVRPDDIFVVGVGIEPSAGMKKGIVNDMGALTAAISASVHKAEKSSGFDIARAFVSVAGSHIASVNSRGAVGIAGQRGVNLDDVDKAMESARAIAIPHNREVLHVVPRSYSLDGQERVRSPIGMHGFRLEVEAHIITASSTSVANLEQSVEAAGVAVDRFILNPLASGDAVLTEQEREMGVVVIDIGGGTTDMAIFIEGTVWHTAVIPVGGDLITNDVTHWMHVPFDVAEAVKVHHGHALQKAVDPLETFLVEPFGEGMPIEVQRNAMAEIMEMRVAEMFDMVKKEIKRSGYDGMLRAGAVITGGCAQLEGLKEVASRELGFPVRIAKPERLTGMADALRAPSYSTSVGLLRMGLSMETAAVGTRVSSVPGKSIPSPNISKVIGGLFKRLLPDGDG
ncbi:MAG: cell division protein FtsA [Anaerolineae bacterium]|nr:cell division protein FtsA [Anaerolineae bacterium]MBN8618793.1 cell division protein FtsA [Anaerolineae bacterium]